MRNIKKALSTVLCAVMLLSALCIFPVTNIVPNADAAEIEVVSDYEDLVALFEDIVSGEYDNENLLKLYKDEIDAMQQCLAEIVGDADEAVIAQLKGLIVTLFPEELATLQIVGETECTTGRFVELKAVISPINVEVSGVVWTSSDSTVGFFSDGRFYGMKAGSVTVTAHYGNLTAEKTVNVTFASGARVIMFDTLVTNVNFIVENTLIVQTTTNLFWPTDEEIQFRLATIGLFEEYVVYINDEIVTPDENGVYTIAANTGDAHVRADGVVSEKEDGEKTSFWEAILNFFKSIADFFRRLFGIIE